MEEVRESLVERKIHRYVLEGVKSKVNFQVIVYSNEIKRRIKYWRNGGNYLLMVYCCTFQ
jgi:hypothetical protein